MTSRNDNPAAQTPINPGDEDGLELIRRWDVAAIAYISTAGAAYYELPSRIRLPGGAVSPPVAIPSTLQLELLGPPTATTEGVSLSGAHALRVHNPVMGVTGVYGRRRQGFEVRFLSGRVFFFDFVYNPDPREPAQAVNRLAILGLTERDEVGFYREVDSLGRGMPRVGGDARSIFELWSSPESQHGSSEILLRDIVVEAGSPAALSGSDDGVFNTPVLVETPRR
ncbi:MAG: hypothetical protein H6739_20390 [Alphaproteobacteria bacterium]|nr:hypothetical protein [Alphaproteobacteria bacterium]